MPRGGRGRPGGCRVRKWSSDGGGGGDGRVVNAHGWNTPRTQNTEKGVYPVRENIRAVLGGDPSLFLSVFLAGRCVGKEPSCPRHYPLTGNYPRGLPRGCPAHFRSNFGYGLVAAPLFELPEKSAGSAGGEGRGRELQRRGRYSSGYSRAPLSTERGKELSEKRRRCGNGADPENAQQRAPRNSTIRCNIMVFHFFFSFRIVSVPSLSLECGLHGSVLLGHSIICESS